MSTQHSASPEEARRREVAIHWFVSLQSGHVSENRIRRWLKWLSSPLNEAAFNEIADLAHQAARLPRPVLSIDAKPARKPHVVPYGLAALFVIVLVGIGIFHLMHMPAPVVYQTAVAKHRNVVLTDGSRIQMGADTVLRVQQDEKSRIAFVDRGEALFMVTHDSSRPFTVKLGRTVVTAVGTEFNVHAFNDGSGIVTVTDGTVLVGLNNIQGKPMGSVEIAAIRKVTRGYEVNYDKDGNLSAVQLADLEERQSWLTEYLKYKDARLGRVMADVNRYTTGKKIVFGDAVAKEVSYSGTVPKNRVQEWLNKLEKRLPKIEIVYEDDRIVISSRATANTDQMPEQ